MVKRTSGMSNSSVRCENDQRTALSRTKFLSHYHKINRPGPLPESDDLVVALTPERDAKPLRHAGPKAAGRPCCRTRRTPCVTTGPRVNTATSHGDRRTWTTSSSPRATHSCAHSLMVKPTGRQSRIQRASIEALRQPLESGRASVARVHAHVTYPARVQLVAAMNPCRCGHLDDAALACGKAPRCAQEYQSRISGPLFDRIDLHIDVPAVRPADLALPPPAEGSAEVAARVAAARARQGGALCAAAGGPPHPHQCRIGRAIARRAGGARCRGQAPVAGGGRAPPSLGVTRRASRAARAPDLPCDRAWSAGAARWRARRHHP